MMIMIIKMNINIKIMIIRNKTIIIFFFDDSNNDENYD